MPIRPEVDFYCDFCHHSDKLVAALNSLERGELKRCLALLRQEKEFTNELKARMREQGWHKLDENERTVVK